MKKLLVFSLFVFVILSACSTVASKVPMVNLSSPVTVKPSAIGETIEFRDGEVLCAMGSDPYREDFYLAKVTTQPSAVTKNQAEVVYVRDGKKEWVNYMIPSRKSTKQELAVGKIVFVPAWHRENKDISSEEYRKDLWKLGRVSSVDELFKDIVEVNGEKYYWQYLRTPDKEP